MNSFYFEPQVQNRNAVIRTRTDRTGKLRTETARRDFGTLNIAVSTDTASDKTRLFIDFDGQVGSGDGVQLSGHEARTLYRVLQKHYENV